MDGWLIGWLRWFRSYEASKWCSHHLYFSALIWTYARISFSIAKLFHYFFLYLLMCVCESKRMLCDWRQSTWMWKLSELNATQFINKFNNSRAADSFLPLHLSIDCIKISHFHSICCRLISSMWISHDFNALIETHIYTLFRWQTL